MASGRLTSRRQSAPRWLGPRGVSLCLMLLVAGCRAVAPPVTDTGAPAAPEIPTITQPTTETPRQSRETPSASAESLPGTATSPAIPAPLPAAPPNTASAVTSQVNQSQHAIGNLEAGRDQSSSTSASAKRSPSPAQPPVSTQPPTGPGSPATAARSAVPDLAVLEQRLRDTRAIGVFTKLSLKNQVDDLLGRFRSAYSAHSPMPTPDLRQRYDLLILKVVTLLQDDDPELARSISFSREALWGILSDPEKFAHIQP